MTLDEAIEHCKEVAEEKENEGKLLCESKGASTECLNCAKEHRQLAKWLEELKEKRNLICRIKKAYESDIYELEDVMNEL